jgi:long-chain acyl-CoA synthetase
MVISGGVNIYPAEVEQVLVGMPEVRDCAIFGVPDEEFGERLVSVIDGEESLTASGVSEFLRGRVSAYKIPREFIFSASLPREDSGKIKKRLLRDAYVAGDLH